MCQLWTLHGVTKLKFFYIYMNHTEKLVDSIFEHVIREWGNRRWYVMQFSFLALCSADVQRMIAETDEEFRDM